MVDRPRRSPVYRDPAPPSPTPPACPACGGEPLGDPGCPECARGVRRLRRRGLAQGLLLSPAVALLVAPALYPGQWSLGMAAVGVWLLAPLGWAWRVGRRGDARSRATARGLALGHALWLGLVVVVVGGGLAVLVAGMPHTD